MFQHFSLMACARCGCIVSIHQFFCNICIKLLGNASTSQVLVTAEEFNAPKSRAIADTLTPFFCRKTKDKVIINEESSNLPFSGKFRNLYGEGARVCQRSNNTKEGETNHWQNICYKFLVYITAFNKFLVQNYQMLLDFICPWYGMLCH